MSPQYRTRIWPYASGGIAVIILLLLLRQCWPPKELHKEYSRVAQLKPKLSPLDPTDSSHGITERLSADRMMLLDTIAKTASKANFRVRRVGGIVIRVQQGGASSIEVDVTPSNARVQRLIINCGDKQKFLAVTPNAAGIRHNARRLQTDIKFDSSLQPGIFEVKIAAEDSSGRLSNWASKWVVIACKVENPDSVLLGRWLMLRSTHVGWVHGHYIQFNRARRCGEWVDFNAQKTPLERIGAMLFIAIQPNWDAMYAVHGDSIFCSVHNRYQIVALNAKRLILKEIAGGDDRFGVFARVSSAPTNALLSKAN